MSSQKLIRPLGAFEQLFWLRSQCTTVHFILAAEVEGATTPEQWRSALNALQKIHPMLSVGIRQQENTSLWFEQRENNPIPLRLVDGNNNTPCWEAEWEKELYIPFNNDDSPLLRAVLIHYPDKSIVSLTAHHSIADGLSLTWLLRDLLEILSGSANNPNLNATTNIPGAITNAPSGKTPFPRSTDELIGITDDALQGPPLSAEGLTAPMQLREKTKTVPHIYTYRLNTALTSLLIRSSREKDATLHGALAAAVVTAGRRIFPKWQTKPIRVLSPISVRNQTNAGEACSLNLVSRWIPFAPDEDRSFWELARFTRNALAEAATPEGIKRSTAGLRQFLNGLDVAGSERVSERFDREVMLTNLGEIKYPTEYGLLKLVSVWGPGIHSGFDDEFDLAACTVNGACSLMVISREPYARLLLDETIRVLTAQLNPEPGSPKTLSY